LRPPCSLARDFDVAVSQQAAAGPVPSFKTELSRLKSALSFPAAQKEPGQKRVRVVTEDRGMFSYHEFAGQASYHKTGEIQVNEHYYTRVKPVWLISLKLLGLAAMVAVAYAIAIPSLISYLPLWQAVVLVAGVMLVYTGIAFFVRPEPNTDNMGIAGGLANDPFQYSDNINRWLWNLHCLLGPGRFASETLLDCCVRLGIAGGEEVVDEPMKDSSVNDTTTGRPDTGEIEYWQTAGEVETPPSYPMTALSPDRFARR